MFCMSCGAALPDSAAFCPACGAKLTPDADPAAPRLHALRCTACGSSSLRKLRSGVFQCEHCGASFYTDGQDPGSDTEAKDADLAVLLSDAAAFAEKKDYKGELKTLVKALEIAPEDNTVLLRLGRAYWRLGSNEKALEYYRAAEELYPEDPVVYINIGSISFKLGHYAEAKAQYEKAIAILRSDPRSACAEDIGIAYGNYAFCLGKLGDRKNAKKYLSLAKENGYSEASIDTICKELHLLRFLI